MNLHSAKEIHDALDGLRDNVNPGLLANAIPSNDPLQVIATLFATSITLALIQARAIALLLERVERLEAITEIPEVK